MVDRQDERDEKTQKEIRTLQRRKAYTIFRSGLRKLNKQTLRRGKHTGYENYLLYDCTKITLLKSKKKKLSFQEIQDCEQG